MIEIRTLNSYSGSRRIDTAEADTPEEAVAAARTLLREARDENGCSKPCASFYVNGKLVRAGIRITDLTNHIEVLHLATKES